MDEKEIVIPENATFKRVYPYEYYSYHRIVQILKENNLYLYPIVWYKCGRYPGYRQRYHIKKCETNQIIRENVSLDDIREIFARLGFPLKETNTKRNKGAEQFLEVVKNLGTHNPE